MENISAWNWINLVLCALLIVAGASPAVSADSSASARHSLQDAVPAATSPATAAAAADAAVGDPVTVAVPSWLSRCSTDSSSSSWGVTLQHLPPQQAIATGAGANQECFSISRQMQCTVSAGSPCCNPSRGPSRLALRIVPGLCSAELDRFSWTVDGLPITFSLMPQGWLLSGRLGTWKSGQAAKQLCVQTTPGAAGTAGAGCASLSDLCKGTNRCRYRLFSAAAAAAAASTAASTASGAGCCLEGNTGDGALLGGDAQPLSVRRAANLKRLESAFQAMQLAAAQLRLAVKTGDAQLAATALKTPISTSSSSVARLASERYAQGVIVTAEQPAEFDGTAFNTPVKSQGHTTMAASYAAVAAFEATVAARLFGGKPDGINLSEKALHWCDAASPATVATINGTASNASWITPTKKGWYADTAMATLAQYGVANTSCYGDAIGVQYPISELGNMSGSCASVLTGCGRLKGFSYIDITPKRDPAAYAAVLEHIRKHHAVAARLQVTSDMLQQLTGLQEDGTMRRSAAAASDIVFGDLNSTTSQDRFGHVVAVVGYNFSSSNASQHYWLIKDSLPGVGLQQYWKLGVSSVVGFGAWIGGFSFSTGTGPDSVTLDPIMPSPKPVDPSGDVKPAPIGLSPSPGPEVETTSVAADSADAAGMSLPLVEDSGKEAAAVLPAVLPVDSSTTGSTPQGSTAGNSPKSSTAGSTPQGGTAGSTPQGGTAGTMSSDPAIRPAIVDPNRIRGNKHQDVNPNDLVLSREERFRPLGQTLMSVSLAQMLGSDVLGAESSAVAVQPTDCDGYTTADMCERLSVIWHKMGGAAAGYKSLVGVLADNFEALSGKDITCFAVGTKLRLCRQ